MSEEQKPNGENESEWSMPEPVFRSSEGRSLRAKEIDHDPEADLTTEPLGFRTGEQSFSNISKQSVRVKEEALGTRHKKKKRGCAKFFGAIAIFIGLIVGLIIATIIYFVFYYRPASTTF